MTDTTAPVTIGYDAIITQLLAFNERIRVAMRDSKAASTYGRHQWLRDFCVVQVGSARQTGKTGWIYQTVCDTDVVIVHNEEFRRCLAERCGFPYERGCTQLYRTDGVGAGGLPIRKMITIYTRQELLEQFKQRPRAKINIELDPDDPNPTATFNRVLQEYRTKREGYRTGHNFKRFIMDDAMRICEGLDLREFFMWVSSMTFLEDPEIIFLG